MQLVYLYIEKYKNIENQEFNFSTQFKCEYKNDVLSVIGNPEYIKNFFGDNIEVSAIVGENGSGKSSVLEAILKIVEDELLENYILVYDDGGLKYISNFEVESSNFKKGEGFREKRNIFSHINTIHKHYAFRHYNTIEIDKLAIANILAVEIGKIKSSFRIASFMYTPTKIEIKLREPEQLIDESINFFAPMKREKVKKIFKSIEDKYHQYLFICYGREKGIDTNIEALSDKEELKTKISNFVDERDFHRYFLSLIHEKIFDISDLTEDQKNIYIRKDGYHHFFDFDMIDEKQLRFNNLSHGEQMLFGQLLNLYFFSDSNTDSLIFLFDEPEIALHPNWQRKYIHEIVSLLRKLNKKYQFIVTSHSPFILSDIPRQNIVFLKEGKQVDGLEQKQTFGANIHTLLSDSFFMSEGLMGEFAKERIEEVIKFLKGISSVITAKEEAWNLISIIGEPFLKQKLEEMYFKKFNDDKLNDKIEQLEKELQRLKNAKS